jgi:hypothetical protein
MSKADRRLVAAVGTTVELNCFAAAVARKDGLRRSPVLARNTSAPIGTVMRRCVLARTAAVVCYRPRDQRLLQCFQLPALFA